MNQIKGEQDLMDLNITVNFICEKVKLMSMNVTGPRKRKL